MKYTIQVNEVKNTDGNIKAFASIVFDECFKITNITILENKEKGQLFVSMPRYRSSQRKEDDEPVYKDVCYPITKEFREALYTKILEEYAQLIDKKATDATEEKSLDSTQNYEEQKQQAE